MNASSRSSWSFSAACIASLAAIVLSVIARPANAGDAVLTWTIATQNTDGTAIPASGTGSLTHTRVEWGSCSGANFGTKAGEQLVAKPATTYTITGLVPGTWCFRAYTRVSGSCPSSPCESAPTNVVTKTLLQPQPNPPGTLVMTASAVYQVIGTPDKFALVPVGDAPPGTPCDPLQSVNGYYAVPRAAVTWYGNVKPQVVVTKCTS